jgi:hypothetical protein
MNWHITECGVPARRYPIVRTAPHAVSLIFLCNAFGLISAYGGSAGPVVSTNARASGASMPLASATSTGTTVAATLHFSVGANMAAIVGGTPFGLTVTVLDGTGSRVPSFTGTLEFSSTDPHAVLPRATVVDTVTETFIVSLASPGSQTISVTAASGSIKGTSEPVAVTSRPPLVITTSMLPEGTVGTEYGSSMEVFQQCAWSPVLGWHYVCFHIGFAQCEKLPPCERFNAIRPCCRTQWNYIGYSLAATGSINGITWTLSAAANSSVPSGLAIDGNNIVGTPAAGSAGNHLVVIEATDGGLPPAHASVSLPLTIRQ